VIEQCWSEDPKKRPTAHQVLEQLNAQFNDAQSHAHFKLSRSWQIDRETKRDEMKSWKKGEQFRVVQSSPGDVAKVVSLFSIRPVAGMDIASVQTGGGVLFYVCLSER
jgi:hypothetical protein